MKSNQCGQGRHFCGALTIIELLISLTLFAVISVAIYGVFSTGIIGWKKSEVAISSFHEIRLSLDRMAREMRNQAPYDKSKLTGTSDEISFISLISFPEEGKSEYIRLARIKYFLEKDEKGLMLFRERVWFPCLEEGGEVDKMKLISEIESLDFQYAEKEAAGDKITMKWEDAWESKEKSPVAIKINLGIRGEKSKKIKRVIYLPPGEEL